MKTKVKSSIIEMQVFVLPHLPPVRPRERETQNRHVGSSQTVTVSAGARVQGEFETRDTSDGVNLNNLEIGNLICKGV